MNGNQTKQLKLFFLHGTEVILVFERYTKELNKGVIAQKCDTIDSIFEIFLFNGPSIVTHREHLLQMYYLNDLKKSPGHQWTYFRHQIKIVAGSIEQWTSFFQRDTVINVHDFVYQSTPSMYIGDVQRLN